MRRPRFRNMFPRVLTMRCKRSFSCAVFRVSDNWRFPFKLPKRVLTTYKSRPLIAAFGQNVGAAGNIRAAVNCASRTLLLVCFAQLLPPGKLSHSRVALRGKLSRSCEVRRQHRRNPNARGRRGRRRRHRHRGRRPGDTSLRPTMMPFDRLPSTSDSLPSHMRQSTLSRATVYPLACDSLPSKHGRRARRTSRRLSTPVASDSPAP